MTLSEAADVRVRVLGTLAVVGADGQPVALGSPKLRRLLAGLVVHAGSVVSVDRLADIVWGDQPPANTTAALHNLVSRLRGRLRAATAGDVAIETRAPGYVLSLAPGVLDATRFAELVARARDATGQGDGGSAALLDRALALWRGEAYAEFTDETFARAEVARLAELRTAAREERVAAALAQDEVDDAIARLEALTAEHPLRERPHAQLMIALYRAGRQADALAVYRSFRARVGDELGLEPSEDLRRVEQQVLRSDPALGATVVAGSGAAAPLTGEGAAAPAANDRRAAVETAGAVAAANAAHASGHSAAGDADAGAVGRPVAVARNRRHVELPPLPQLVGRAALLADLRDALRPAALVTLVGPGGVGKTSVALHAAAELGGPHADGMWWCDLAAVDTADAVVERIMTAVDAQRRQGVTAIESLVDVLRPRRALLALDNAEHVVDAVAAVADAILRACPEITVLVTSRERLGAPAEQVVTVPPLPVPPAPGGGHARPGGDAGVPDGDGSGGAGDARDGDGPAVELFVRRAQAALPEFSLTPDTRDPIIEICRKLDGLPLALELAATRMRSMTPADLAGRLSWRFRLLRGGRRAGAERHRTLRAVVDWSYDLLEPDARHVFDVLSVFAGAFTLEAAEQVVARAASGVDVLDVADLVATLVDASMVVAQTSRDTTVYVLLETLRAYGRERLDARGSATSARRAHAVYHVELAERVTAQLFHGGDASPADVLDRAFDELRVAHAWCLDHDLDLALRLVAALPPYAEHRALGEAFAWAERTVEAVEALDHESPHLAAAYGAASLSARFRGDLEHAGVLADRGLATVSDPNDPAVFLCRYTLSEIALYEGRLDETMQHVDDVLRIPVGADHRVFKVWLRSSRILITAYRGDGATAVVDAERFLDEARRGDAAIEVAWASYVLAETLVELDPQRALPRAEDALARGRALDDRFLVGVSLVTAASLHARHGDAARALALFGETVDRWHRAGNWTQQWVAARSIVGLLLRLEADTDAAVLYGVIFSRSTAPRPFGADARRLDEADAELRRRLGPDGVAAAVDRGRAMRDNEAIVWLRDALDRAGAAAG